MTERKLRFTGEWPPVELWDQYPNWEHALDEGDVPGQDETTLRPAREQAVIAEWVAFTAGKVRCASGAVLPAMIELEANGEPAGVHALTTSSNGWSIRRLGSPAQWQCITHDWLPLAKRPPTVSFDDSAVFPLDVLFAIPHEPGALPRTFRIVKP